MIETIETIRHVMTIKNRGLVVFPAIPFGSNANVRVGDHAYIISPTNEFTDFIIRGMELIRTSNPMSAGVLLPADFVESDVVIGSRFFGISDSPMDGTHDAPVFAVGDNVSVRLNARNRTSRNGTIVSKEWHHKNGLWYYYIRQGDGSAVSKRYTAACFAE